MIKTVPVVCAGETVGRGRMETDFLYTRLYIQIPYRAGLWNVWAVGTAGEMRVGIPEPDRHGLILKRRLSLRTLAPAGRILRLELRRHGSGTQAAYFPPAPQFPDMDADSMPHEHLRTGEPPRNVTADKPPRNSTADEPLQNGVWEAVAQIPLHTEELTRQLSGNPPGTLRRRDGEYWTLAFPWDTDAPFPLPGLFCLARVRNIAGRAYCVFTFDRREKPVL